MSLKLSFRGVFKYILMEHFDIFTPRYNSGYIMNALKAGVGNFFEGLGLLPGAPCWLYHTLLMKFKKKTEKIPYNHVL